MSCVLVLDEIISVFKNEARSKREWPSLVRAHGIMSK